MSELFQSIGNWYLANLNYGTVTLFMGIESTFLPFPSEIIVPPAAFKAAGGEMDLLLVVVFATLGSVLGSLVNYGLALWIGRPLLHKIADTRLAHFFHVNRENLEKAEAYFRKHGRGATFLGRLVPGVRHLISIPAGLARMNLWEFLGFTALGAGLWSGILALLGYFLYSQREIFSQYFEEISWGLLILGVAFVLYLVVWGWISWTKKKKGAGEPAP